MSQAKNNELFKSIIAVVAILGIVALVQAVVLTMMYGGVGNNKIAATEDSPAMLAERIKPAVTLADIRGGNEKKAVVAAVVAEKSAKELYDVACMACHNNGVAGAPKPGDKAAWESRYTNGMDSLLASVVNGKGAMPPKGGSAYSEAEITKIIEYILIESDLMKAKAASPAKQEVAATATEATVTASIEAEPIPAKANNDFDLTAGKSSYASACGACHNSGIAGAPKLGVAADWTSRKDSGLDALSTSAINGKGAMPAKGGASYLSDADIKNIVGYMLSKI